MMREYGLDDRLLTLAASPSSLDDPADRVLGRVVRIDRGFSTVATDDGPLRCELAQELRDAPEPEFRPAIGDWVLVEGDVIVDVLERTSAFRRGDADRLQAQVVAANVDVLFVVHEVDPQINLRRLERELALAWESGATPVVVLTKADLCGDVEAVVSEVERAAPATDIIVTSAPSGHGIEALAARAAPNRTIAFIGASGVGKSSLVNRLLGSAAQEIGAVRESDGRGRHTTTHRELFLIPGGGVVIDTPGLRSIGMWQSDDGISRVFADVEALAEQCRFRDCAHDREPECAVRAAVEAGTIEAARVRNYREMLAELDGLDRESELRARLERKRHAKILSRAVRRLPKR